MLWVISFRRSSDSLSLVNASSKLNSEYTCTTLLKLPDVDSLRIDTNLMSYCSDMSVSSHFSAYQSRRMSGPPLIFHRMYSVYRLHTCRSRLRPWSLSYLYFSASSRWNCQFCGCQAQTSFAAVSESDLLYLSNVCIQNHPFYRGAPPRRFSTPVPRDS